MRDQITAKGNRERRDTATLRTRINESNTTDAFLLSRGGGGGGWWCQANLDTLCK